MIRLEISREPRWLDLGHGVEVLAAPMTMAVMMAVKADLLADTQTGAGNRTADELGVDLTKAAAKRLVRDWRGVGDCDGNVLAPSPEAVAALIDLKPFYEAFHEQVLAPWFFVGEEKNASGPLSSGNSAGALNTAPDAANSAKTAPASATAPGPATAG